MYLQSHSCLPLWIISLILFPFSFGTFEENPLSKNLDRPPGYDPTAYPTYYGSIDGSYGNYGIRFKATIKYDDEVFYKRERFLLAAAPASDSPVLINVEDFGAKSGGNDDTEAFKEAWKEACATSSSEVTFVVPKSKMYLLKPIKFSGPCKSQISVKIYGTIEASKDQSDYEDRRHWLVFSNLENLTVHGGGTINGNGKIWWKKSCKIDKTQPCANAPTALTFYECKNLVVDSIVMRNAQQMHLVFQKCVNVRATNLLVTAPGSSPNTDGIHVTQTQNIQIKSCTIKTGDDCISIVSGSKRIQALDITCGPGHGISIGSLGDGNQEAHVSEVVVNRARISGTMNGVRIKSYQGGSGSAKNIKFQNVAMYNVSNPIVIDQYYCDKTSECPTEESAVQVKDVVYKNIRGSSFTEFGINLNCSNTHPCRGIILQDINLVREGNGQIKATCESAQMETRGSVFPKCS